jgi:hypothetical protein
LLTGCSTAVPVSSFDLHMKVKKYGPALKIHKKIYFYVIYYLSFKSFLSISAYFITGALFKTFENKQQLKIEHPTSEIKINPKSIRQLADEIRNHNTPLN